MPWRLYCCKPPSPSPKKRRQTLNLAAQILSLRAACRMVACSYALLGYLHWDPEPSTAMTCSNRNVDEALRPQNGPSISLHLLTWQLRCVRASTPEEGLRCEQSVLPLGPAQYRKQEILARSSLRLGRLRAVQKRHVRFQSPNDVSGGADTFMFMVLGGHVPLLINQGGPMARHCFTARTCATRMAASFALLLVPSSTLNPEP